MGNKHTRNLIVLTVFFAIIATDSASASTKNKKRGIDINTPYTISAGLSPQEQKALDAHNQLLNSSRTSDALDKYNSYFNDKTVITPSVKTVEANTAPHAVASQPSATTPPSDQTATLAKTETPPAATPQKPAGIFKKPLLTKLKDSVARSRADKRSTIEIAAETYHYRYKEPGLMSNTGLMYGIFVGGNYYIHEPKKIQPLFKIIKSNELLTLFRVEGRYTFGDLDYTSYTTGGDNGQPNYTYDLRALFGHEAKLTENTSIMPYIGYGFRYLNDNGEGRLSSSGNWAYERESNYHYLPLGLQYKANLKRKWSMKVILEYDYLMHGKQISHLENGGAWLLDGDGNYNNTDALENRQTKGLGLRASVRMTKETTHFDFFFEPFIRYWSIEESTHDQITSDSGRTKWYLDAGHTIPYTGWEPENDTTEYGLTIGFNF